MSYLTGTSAEVIYSNPAPFTAKNTFTTEIAINDVGATTGERANIPPYFFQPGGQEGRALKIIARGILSSTATPTYTFSLRLGTTGSITAAIALGSAALTTGSGVTNQLWEFQGDIQLVTLAGAGANSTLRGLGLLASGGLASPFSYALFGGAASPGTVATFDASITNYFNFNVACSASSASNTITLLQLIILGLN